MQTRRRLVIIAALAGTFLASLDVTVVGTAMPTIIAQLGGLSIYPWVFSIYLLGSTVTMPLYGKAADLFGRKPVYLAAIGLFLIGSVLCTTAGSMTALIIWRGVQGIGAGGVMPATITIVGDLYAPDQRARIQGLFSAVWAVSSVAGPALGAVIVEGWTWHWIFLLNIPFGIAAAAIMVIALHEEVERRQHRFDLAGAGLLAAGAALLMIGMLRTSEGGFRDPWVLACLAAAALLGAGFVFQERRHPEPMMPPVLFRNPVVLVAVASGLFGSGVLFCTTSYMPAFVQGVLGGGPLDAGAAIIPLGIAWPLASTSSGWFLRRVGYRATLFVGCFFLAAGATGLFWFTNDMSRWQVMTDMAVIGLGMGFTYPTLMIAAQSTVPWQQRGATTALVQFSRTIGGAVTVAAMGAVLNGTLNDTLADRPELVEVANAVLDPRRRAGLSAEVVATVRGALGSGLLRVLVGTAICGLVAAALALFFPKGVEVETSSHSRTHLIPRRR